MDIVGIIKIIHIMNVINIIHIGLRLLMTMANLVFFRIPRWVSHDGVACSSGTRFFVSTVGFMFAGLIAATVP